MAIGMGALLPLGAGLARFAKRVPPTSGPKACWFRAHRYVQSIGLLLSALGVILAFAVVVPAGSHLSDPHHQFGLFVMLYAAFQV
jgi:hypothetical protein